MGRFGGYAVNDNGRLIIELYEATDLRIVSGYVRHGDINISLFIKLEDWNQLLTTLSLRAMSNKKLQEFSIHINI